MNAEQPPRAGAAALLLCRAAHAVFHPGEAELLIERALAAARNSRDPAARRRIGRTALLAIDFHARQPRLAGHARAEKRLAMQRRVAEELAGAPDPAIVRPDAPR